MEVAVMDESVAAAPWNKPPPLPPSFGRRCSWGSDSNSARGSPRGLPVSIVLNDTPRSNSIGSPHSLPPPPVATVERGVEEGGVRDREVARSPGRPAATPERGDVAGRAVRVHSSFPTLRSMCEESYVEPVSLRSLGRLGEGTLTVVEKSEMGGGPGAPPRIVAVKRIRGEALTKAGAMEIFVKEYGVVKDHRNKNIVELIGVGSMDTSSETKMRQSVYIVQEYMDGGSLRDMVLKKMRDPQGEVYSMADAFRWLVQIAEGLAFLYEHIPNGEHRDLKLENILLTGSTASDMQAKVADFGLAAALNRSQVRRKVEKFTSNEKSVLFSRHKKLFLKVQSAKVLDKGTKGKYGVVGSLPYMAPEVYAASKYNEKADVFSFGIVMYEVLRARIILLSLPLDGSDAVIEDHARKVAGGFRPPIPAQWPKAWKELVAACWAERPEDRPAMAVVAERLKLMVFNGIDEVPNGAPSCCCVVQ